MQIGPDPGRHLGAMLYVIETRRPSAYQGPWTTPQQLSLSRNIHHDWTILVDMV